MDRKEHWDLDSHLRNQMIIAEAQLTFTNKFEQVFGEQNYIRNKGISIKMVDQYLGW